MKKKKKISRHDKLLKDFCNAFNTAGIYSVYKKGGGNQFEKQGFKGDIDLLGVYGNLGIIAEIKTGNDSNSSDKFLIFEKKAKKFISKDLIFDYLRWLKKEKNIKININKFKDIKKWKLIFLGERADEGYLSKFSKKVLILNEDDSNYFCDLASKIGMWARFEFFGLLNLKKSEVQYTGEALLPPEPFPAMKPRGTYLSDEVIMFNMTPNELLPRAHVLRREGFKSLCYQRLLNKDKLREIREFLCTYKKKYFPNNIIVSVPRKCKLISKKYVKLPQDFCSITIIDGQHRVFAFAQDNEFKRLSKLKGKKKKSRDVLSKEKKYDSKIKELSKTMPLIITAVKSASEDEINRIRNEASIFIDINYTPTKIKKDLIYALKLDVLNQEDDISIALSIIRKLNDLPAFNKKFKLKNLKGSGNLRYVSIIDYALAELVSLKSNKQIKNLFTISPYHKKEKLNKKELRDYIEFCSKLIDIYFSKLKEILVKEEEWEYDFYRSTIIVSYLRLLRHFFYNYSKTLFHILNKKKEYNKKKKEALENIFKSILKIPRINISKLDFRSSRWASFEKDLASKIDGKKGFKINWDLIKIKD